MWKNKKGNILKGKVLSLRILIVLLISLMASFCFVFAFASLNKVDKDTNAFYSIATLNDEEYSALLDGNVILSVEKVFVNSQGSYHGCTVGDCTHGCTIAGCDHTVPSCEQGCVDENCPNKTLFVPNTLTGGDVKTFQANYDEFTTNETYTFQDVRNGSKTKEDPDVTVIRQVLKTQPGLD